jgi:pilus assembly protein FimV
MLALKDANPDAFINNNINLLKAGHVLRIPDAEQIRAHSIAAAVAEVRVQNEEFVTYRNDALAQLDGSKRQSGRATDGANSNDGELKLLATNNSSGETAGDGSAAANQALQSDLDVAEEDLDRARRANSELNVRMEDLQGQLDTLTEILKLKDDQLTALRAEVQKMQANADAVQPKQQVAQNSGSFFTSPLFLGVIMLILVIVVVAVLLMVRKRRTQENTEDDFEEEAVDAVEQDTELQDTEETETRIEEDEEDIAPETTDVIGEVEIYIAYGRFPQAITFLHNAIESEPNRTDIQLKLLEVFVQTEDSVAFNLQFEQLKLLGDSDAIAEAEALQQKIPGAVEDLGISMDATANITDPTDESIDIDVDEEVSFDLDDLGSETEDDSLSIEEDELDLDLDDDDELSLDLDDDGATSLDLDDDDEFSLELDDDGAISLDLDDDDELSLELDDDGAISLNLDDEELDVDLDSEIELDDDGAFSLDLDADDNKLDLARAYIDMGDSNGARGLLEEVLKVGTEAEILEANELLEKIS